MDAVEGRKPEREQGPSEQESAPERRDSLRPCSACGKPIAAGAGRFNVGKKRYHVECYDPTRHLTPPAPPDPSV